MNEPGLTRNGRRKATRAGAETHPAGPFRRDLDKLIWILYLI